MDKKIAQLIIIIVSSIFLGCIDEIHNDTYIHNHGENEPYTPTAVPGIIRNTNYYVAPWGINANDGLSINTPKKDFDVKNWFNSGNVKPGDTIYLLDGTWTNESIYFNTISGTASKPVTLTAFRGKPTLDGGNIRIGGNGDGFISEYINVSGLTIKNTGIGVAIREASNITIENSEIGNVTAHAVFISDSYDVTLKNNDLHDTGHNSLFIQANRYDVHNVRVINNKIHENPGTSGRPGHNLIDFYIYGKGVGLNNILIEGNELYNVSTNGIFEHEEDTKNGYVQMTNIIIKKNILWNIGTNGIKINYLGNSLISDNVILNANEMGIKSDIDSFNIGGFNDGIILQNNSVKFSKEEDISLAGHSHVNTILLRQNDIDTYRIDKGIGIVEDPKRINFHLRTAYTGNIILKFTKKRPYKVSGGSISYYPENGEFATNGDEFVTVNINSNEYQ